MTNKVEFMRVVFVGDINCINSVLSYYHQEDFIQSDIMKFYDIREGNTKLDLYVSIIENKGLPFFLHFCDALVFLMKNGKSNTKNLNEIAFMKTLSQRISNGLKCSITLSVYDNENVNTIEPKIFNGKPFLCFYDGKISQKVAKKETVKKIINIAREQNSNSTEVPQKILNQYLDFLNSFSPPTAVSNPPPSEGNSQKIQQLSMPSGDSPKIKPLPKNLQLQQNNKPGLQNNKEDEDNYNDGSAHNNVSFKPKTKENDLRRYIPETEPAGTSHGSKFKSSLKTPVVIKKNPEQPVNIPFNKKFNIIKVDGNYQGDVDIKIKFFGQNYYVKGVFPVENGIVDINNSVQWPKLESGSIFIQFHQKLKGTVTVNVGNFLKNT